MPNSPKYHCNVQNQSWVATAVGHFSRLSQAGAKLECAKVQLRPTRFQPQNSAVVYFPPVSAQ